MHFALRFYIEKNGTLRYGFIFKKPDTFCYILICKKNVLRVTFLYLKPNYKRTYDQSDHIEK